jgi:peptide/nickel transport system ATP-binding protein
MSALLAMEAVSKSFGERPGFIGALAARSGIRALAPPPTLVRAVDGVSLSIAKSEVVGLIGESGAGKSTRGRLAAGILPPDTGTIRFSGRAWNEAGKASSRDMRLGVQMIFQDLSSSLPPRLPVGGLIGEAPRVHGLVGKDRLDAYVDEMMTRVGLTRTGGTGSRTSSPAASASASASPGRWPPRRT